MKVVLTQNLIDIRDNDFFFIDRLKKNSQETETVPLSLLMVFGESLANVDAKENLSAEEKYKLAKLLYKVYTHKEECDLSIEELAVIKQRIVKFYNPLVVLAVDKILEK